MKSIKSILVLLAIVSFSQIAFANNIKDPIKVISTTSAALEEAGYSVIQTSSLFLSSEEADILLIDVEKGKEYIIYAVFSDQIKNLNLDVISTENGKILKTDFEKTAIGAKINFQASEDQLELLITNRKSIKRGEAREVNYIIASK